MATMDNDEFEELVCRVIGAPGIVPPTQIPEDFWKLLGDVRVTVQLASDGVGDLRSTQTIALAWELWKRTTNH